MNLHRHHISFPMVPNMTIFGHFIYFSPLWRHTGNDVTSGSVPNCYQAEQCSLGVHDHISAIKNHDSTVGFLTIKYYLSISFNKYKFNIYLDPYLLNLNPRFRIALSRFRISNHSLWIEKGRHMKPMIERDNRFCDFCKTEIEDEHHFLLCCPLYGPKRIILENVCRNTCNRYDLLNKDEKFIFIMSNEDKEVLKALGKYFSEGMRLRDKIVEYFFTWEF